MLPGLLKLCFASKSLYILFPAIQVYVFNLLVYFKRLFSSISFSWQKTEGERVAFGNDWTITEAVSLLLHPLFPVKVNLIKYWPSLLYFLLTSERVELVPSPKFQFTVEIPDVLVVNFVSVFSQISKPEISTFGWFRMLC